MGRRGDLKVAGRIRTGKNGTELDLNSGEVSHCPDSGKDFVVQILSELEIRPQEDTGEACHEKNLRAKKIEIKIRALSDAGSIASSALPRISMAFDD
jgi:hypothetical protein